MVHMDRVRYYQDRGTQLVDCHSEEKYVVISFFIGLIIGGAIGFLVGLFI